MIAYNGHLERISATVPLNTFTSMSCDVPGTVYKHRLRSLAVQLISLENCHNEYVFHVVLGKSFMLPLKRAYHNGTRANAPFDA